MMYKYFFVYRFTNAQGLVDFGSSTMEMNCRITDFNNIENINLWLIEAAKHIANTGNLKDVIVLNFQLIN